MMLEKFKVICKKCGSQDCRIHWKNDTDTFVECEFCGIKEDIE